MESTVDTEGEGKPKKKVHSARMIMRTDGVLRVVLNSPIFKGMKVGDAEGHEPTGKQINLAGIENGKSIPLLLRVRATWFTSVISLSLANSWYIDRKR